MILLVYKTSRSVDDILKHDVRILYINSNLSYHIYSLSLSEPYSSLLLLLFFYFCRESCSLSQLKTYFF